MRYSRQTMMFSLAAVLLLSGCELFQHSKLVGYPGAVKLTGSTDPVEPPMKSVAPVPVPSPSGRAAAAVPSDGGAPPSAVPSVPNRQPPAGDAADQTRDARPAVPAVPPRALAAGEPTRRYRNATLAEDTRWSGTVLVEGGVTVAPQATLTVEPGTIVRFGTSDDSEGTQSVLLVYGRLQVSGTPERPVLMTSRYLEPRPGDWQGVVFMGSEKRNSIENCRIEGADTGLDAAFSSLTLKNTTLSGCTVGARIMDSLVSVTGGGPVKCDTGIVASDSELDLREGEVKGNRRGVVVTRTSLSVAAVLFVGNEKEALTVTSSRLKLLNSNFEMNGAGLQLTDSEGNVSYDRFRENSEYGAFLRKARLKVTGNEFSSNIRAGLKVDGCNCAIWNNALYGNGADLYNEGSDDVRAVGNWWGAGSVVEIEKRIFDRRREPGKGRVVITPILAGNPLSP